MKELVIVGAGGFGRELLQWVNDINAEQKKWHVVGFIDDNLNALNGYECECEIISTINDYEANKNHELAIAIANPQIKEAIVKKLKSKGAVFTSVIHPTAIISAYAQIGEGLIMYPYSNINRNTRIGDFVTLLSSGIGHDATIGDYCTISSYCDITGGVNLAERVFLGSHTTIVPGRNIGSDAFVAAGSVVVTNIGTKLKVAGNPARKMYL